MLTIIPFLPEVADYKELAERILAAGACKNHSVHILTLERDAVQANDFRQSIETMFAKAEVNYVPNRMYPPVAAGRQFGRANDFFRTAATVAANHQDDAAERPGAPWLYLDPEYEPVKPKWLDTIQTAYYESGKSVVGLPKKGPDKVVRGPYGDHKVDGAFVMEGPVVLPRDLIGKSPVLATLRDSEHWRLDMRWELSVSHSEAKILGRGNEAVLRKARRKTQEPAAASPVPTGGKKETKAPDKP